MGKTKPQPGKSLADVNPRLAKEWHPQKNQKRPQDVYPSSGKKVWWLCPKKHSYESRPLDRNLHGNGCPYCSGRFATLETCLATTNPGLAAQWHPTKNGLLTPQAVLPKSDQKVWWLCSKCDYDWNAQIKQRTARELCPQCEGRKVTENKNLAKLHPEVARQLHPTKNGEISAEAIAAKSGKKVWWLCDICGKEWKTTVNSRTAGNGCPGCSGHAISSLNNLQTKNPALASEWHPTKNLPLTPTDVMLWSRKLIWWYCNACGTSWESRAKDRLGGTTCPGCKGLVASKIQNLEKEHPAISKQWHPTKNGELRPSEVLSGARKIVWWICPKDDCKYEWRANCQSRTKKTGTGCPACSGLVVTDKNRLSTRYPELIVEWSEKNDIQPTEVSYGSAKKVWWSCQVCQHNWRTTPNARKSGEGCPSCATTGFNTIKPGCFYALKVTEESSNKVFLKFGIAGVFLNRLAQLKANNPNKMYSLLFEPILFKSGKDAYDLEIFVKKKFKQHLKKPKDSRHALRYDGYTETLDFSLWAEFLKTLRLKCDEV